MTSSCAVVLYLLNYVSLLVAETSLADVGNPATNLTLCQGDCDSDGDCTGDLVCYKREGDETVPGCSGNGQQGWEYCTLPPLVFVGNPPDRQLNVCEGDCDENSDCNGELICYQRDAYEPVPGCRGPLDIDTTDYCIQPPTATPTNNPTPITTTPTTQTPTPGPSSQPTRNPTDRPTSGTPMLQPTASPTVHPTTADPTTANPTTRQPSTAQPTRQQTTRKPQTDEPSDTTTDAPESESAGEQATLSSLVSDLGAVGTAIVAGLFVFILCLCVAIVCVVCRIRKRRADYRVRVQATSLKSTSQMMPMNGARSQFIFAMKLNGDDEKQVEHVTAGGPSDDDSGDDAKTDDDALLQGMETHGGALPVGENSRTTVNQQTPLQDRVELDIAGGDNDSDDDAMVLNGMNATATTIGEF